MPYSFPLKQGLFELRERKYGYRIYYCFHGKQIAVLLAAGDKSTQKRDIALARKRLNYLKISKIEVIFVVLMTHVNACTIERMTTL